MTLNFGEPPLLPSVLAIGKAPLLGPGFSSVRFARSFRQVLGFKAYCEDIQVPWDFCFEVETG